MHQLRIINEDHKGRWFGANLCPKVETQALPGSRWWHRFVIGIVEDLVKFASRQAMPARLHHFHGGRQHLVNPLTGLGADKEHRDIAEELEIFAHLTLKVIMV